MCGRRLSPSFHQFFVKFAYSLARLDQLSAPLFRNGVNAPNLSFDQPLFRSQISPTFQPMQQWIKCAGPDAIAMASKLFNHPQAKHRPHRRVVQHVKANEPGIKIMIGHRATVYIRTSASGTMTFNGPMRVMIWPWPPIDHLRSYSSSALSHFVGR